MRQHRPFLSVALAAVIALPFAQSGAAAAKSVIVDYSVLDRLPPATPGATAPRLIPPSLVRKVAPPATVAEPQNAPERLNAAVPPVFQNDAAAYNQPDDVMVSQQELAALEPLGTTATTRAPRPGNAEPPAANSVAPRFTNEMPPALVAWHNARPLGNVTFIGGGVQVMDIDAASLDRLDLMAARLSDGGGRVLLKAFGGPAGDKSHEAHLTALRRGLAVRHYLIARGVPSTRIDVRAFGGATDGGPQDRVDVVISAS